MQVTGARRISEYCIGNLKWSKIGDQSGKWNAPIRAALALEHGKLTFFRMQDGVWHSSGALLDNLPRKVIPCIFMTSFMGYVKVKFEGMLKSTPDILGCDVLGHGLRYEWTKWF